MTRTDIRTANLRHLVNGLLGTGLNKREAAARMDLSPSFLSQLLGGKTIGDKVARGIEEQLRLETGALDQPLREGLVNTSTIPLASSQSGRLDRDTLQDAIRLLEELTELQQAPADLCHDAKAILIAYEVVSEFGGGSGNVIDLTKRIAAKLRGMDNGTPGERSSAA